MMFSRAQNIPLEHEHSGLFCAGNWGQAYSATSPHFLILLRLTSTYLLVFFPQK